MQLKSTPQKKPVVSNHNSSNMNTRLRGVPPPKTPGVAVKRVPSTATTVSKSQAPNPHLCAVCSGPQNKNKLRKPERFIRCSVCRRRGKWSSFYFCKLLIRCSNRAPSSQLIPPALTCPPRCSSGHRNTRGSAPSASPVKSATGGQTRNRCRRRRRWR